MNTRVNTLFYIILMISFIVYLMPGHDKMAVYTPNVLGFFWLLVCLLIPAITYLWSSILDLKQKNWRSLIIRSVIFIFSDFNWGMVLQSDRIIKHYV